ncbi:uncharacterized protein LOC131932289 isoform X2 [Physella acuta]|uniref:uncharacterized protein LOC131932289 isoform X2 n=1 Tax=Physella acuta TaxID=109671 RepID=UPI0027DADFF2|nr:uncharacterized protein LOC131932289 isoform X2 [Physella acuta]XP_059145143.1 uncharacterized protein LOC131932289 isoform X2 [Physella acuta]XP_059145144.1 uncharacterized protein LOC131932289 isoform X2 [Physella acuta]XP_059145145.1 uncharacterized protein LOC131932289 isoform X2 [Physella acuta]XP_059145146.1 uncharacterized protein LOC131932289 isoform X2 [Physella acuta]
MGGKNSRPEKNKVKTSGQLDSPATSVASATSDPVQSTDDSPSPGIGEYDNASSILHQQKVSAARQRQHQYEEIVLPDDDKTPTIVTDDRHAAVAETSSVNKSSKSAEDKDKKKEKNGRKKEKTKDKTKEKSKADPSVEVSESDATVYTNVAAVSKPTAPSDDVDVGDVYAQPDKKKKTKNKLKEDKPTLNYIEVEIIPNKTKSPEVIPAKTKSPNSYSPTQYSNVVPQNGKMVVQ